MELVNELAQEPEFIGLAPVPDSKEKAREREELITRFFAYSDGLDDYRDRVALFLYQYVKKMNEAFEKNAEMATDYKNRFIETMDFMKKTFPLGFRKSKMLGLGFMNTIVSRRAY